MLPSRSMATSSAKCVSHRFLALLFRPPVDVRRLDVLGPVAAERIGPQIVAKGEEDTWLGCRHRYAVGMERGRRSQQQGGEGQESVFGVQQSHLHR